jgi:hypothetical protein
MRLHGAHDLGEAGLTVLYARDEAGEGQTITGEHPINERDHSAIRAARAGTAEILADLRGKETGPAARARPHTRRAATA